MSLSTNHSLFWFRNDLRIEDNPGLYNFSKHAKNKKIIILYIHDEGEQGLIIKGSAQSWWLYNALEDLKNSIEKIDAKLTILVGNTSEVLSNIIKKYNINEVYLNNGYDPISLSQENFLINNDVCLKLFSANTLSDPKEILKDNKTSYQVFTPYWRKLLKENKVRTEVACPNFKNYDFKTQLKSYEINKLGLLHKWSDKFSKYWDPTQKGAKEKLDIFLKNNLKIYKTARDYPATEGTSKLSPYLHFGQISPVQVWHKAMKIKQEIPKDDFDCFLSELGWREFSYYLLFYFPAFPKKNFRNKFDDFKWENSKALFNAWSKAKTGYPIIDAGMRELYETGFMHNRVRMIVASFLTKHGLVHWKLGAKWFSFTLLDSDIASNNAGWQWVAGTGADAAPYFRIFNPIRQSEKFDKKGEYLKKWLPELNLLPEKFVHAPHLAPKEVLQKAGVIIGDNYPKIILDLDAQRKKALDNYSKIK